MLMNSYETVNDVLVKLFNEIMDVEERALLTSEYKDISVNDMHVIEAIGIREPKNMSTVARAVSVTVGTLTIAINHLVKKGYVERSRSEEDRRETMDSVDSQWKESMDDYNVMLVTIGRSSTENGTYLPGVDGVDASQDLNQTDPLGLSDDERDLINAACMLF